MPAHGAVAYAGSYELDQPSPSDLHHRRRSLPFLIVSPLLAMVFLVAAVLTAVLVTAVLAVYLVALASAVVWGLLGPHPGCWTQRESVEQAVRGLNGWITRTRSGGDQG